jgi:integrase/recombinase XerD
LRLFFAHLVERGVIRENPGAAIVIPKLPERLPKKILTQDEIRRIMAAPDRATAKGLRDRAILEMLYSTALRRSEMAALCVLDVDLASGIVRVNHGKGGKDRVTPLGEQACEAVKKYLARSRNAWSRRAPQERALWLGSRSPHLPLSKIRLGSVVRDAAKAAGLSRPIHPHVFRHSCATHMVQGGSNIALVQQLLGHQSLATTQIYTRVAVPDLVAMIARAHPRK